MKVENDETVCEVQCDTPVQDIVNLIKTKKKEVVLIDSDSDMYFRLILMQNSQRYEKYHFMFSSPEMDMDIVISKKEGEENYSWKFEAYPLLNVHVNGKNAIKTEIIEHAKNVTYYITGADITVPEKTSDLTNDSGFITSADIPAAVVPDWNSTSS